MLQIESLHITNFRGIRRLTLDLHRKNFGICGNNGTGKSGVVDAIEFALTGSISRLSGRGTAGLSVKIHGPHVDHRDEPETAKVVLKVYFPDLQKSSTIERDIKSPWEPTITPSDPQIKALVEEAAAHPELALSRREILKYVLTEPGERSKEVQALLKLDALEKVRAALQTTANASKAELKRYEADVATARTNLLAGLKVEEVKAEVILAATNERRAVLGLTPLTTLGKDTSLKEGVLQAQRRPSVSKTSALSDVIQLRTLLTAADPGLDGSRDETVALLLTLEEQPTLLANLRKQSFLATGLTLIDDALCPLCDHGWDVEELRVLVRKKLEEAHAAQSLQEKLTKATLPIRQALSSIISSTSTCVSHCGRLNPLIDTTLAASWSGQLEALRTSLEGVDAVSLTKATLQRDWRCLPEGLGAWIDSLMLALEALPDSSAEEFARDYLSVAQERLEAYQKARRQEALWRTRADLAARAAATYAESSRRVLTDVYGEVEADFSRFYQVINREDEAAFHAKLTPAQGKLTFDVDFYGRGMFPPGAYHSEGHQDGMGLCLYLALMRRILGAQFRLAILDDVLMSVDAGHRKEVCKLLKAEFPDTQFIVTTHDPIWLQHMLAERIVTSKSVVQFRKWTVEDGPLVWNHEEVWAEISRDLQNDDVPGASHTLRRYLEYLSTELSGKLRAKVEFSVSGGYDLGELLAAVVAAWGSLLKKGKEAAQSWGQTDLFEVLKLRHEVFRARLDRSQVEQWAINTTVHYNAWATLQKEDFQPVVDAFKELAECFTCTGCGAFMYVNPPKGTGDSVRCECGTINFNLKKKT